MMVAGIVLGVLGSIAAAHPILVQSIPAAGSSVVPPERLVLRFNSRIEKALSSITLIGEGQKTHARLTPEPAPAPEVLIHRLPVLAPGRYAARWKVLAADGHVGEGVVSFTVVAPATTE